MVITEKFKNTSMKKKCHLKSHNLVINTINFLVSFLIDFISHKYSHWYRHCRTKKPTMLYFPVI